MKIWWVCVALGETAVTEEEHLLDALRRENVDALVADATNRDVDSFEKMFALVQHLIHRASEDLDEMTFECEGKQQEFAQQLFAMQSDIADLSGEFAGLRAQVASAQGSMEMQEKRLEKVHQLREGRKRECREEHEEDASQLAIHETHERMMGFLLDKAKCNTVSFLQSAMRAKVTRCADGTVEVSSPMGTFTLTTKEPKNFYAPPFRCVSASLTCHKLVDLLHALTGKESDEKKELYTAMMHKTTACEEALTLLNTDLQGATDQMASAQSEMASATSSQSSVGAQLERKTQDHRMVEKDQRVLLAQCQQKRNEIDSSYCMYRTLRNKLLVSRGLAEAQDCKVGPWSEGDCSTQCNGGTQTLTREVLMKRNARGTKCPVLIRERACNAHPCPIECKVGEWSNWSSCTADCGGGIQSRTRDILQEPQHGAPRCRRTDVQTCNTGSCSRDCELRWWSDWSPCSTACGGGKQRQKRRIRKAAIGDGTCPSRHSSKRLRIRECNKDKCPDFQPKCAAPYDVVVVTDASGSWGRPEVFEGVKQVAIELTQRFDKAAVVEFSERARTLNDAHELHFVGAGTKIATGLIAAKQQLMFMGRPSVPSLIFVITDAQTTTYKFDLLKVGEQLDRTGVRLVLLVPQLPHGPREEDVRALQQMLRVDAADVIVRPVEEMTKAAVLASCQDISPVALTE